MTDVRGGNAGGYLNTQGGHPGVVYRDSIPRLGQIETPEDNATVTNGNSAFRFTVIDLSGTLDDRSDAISPLIELSQDGFKTIAYSFNSNVSLSGWSKAIYFSGDLVQYTPMDHITNGVYEWRVALRDQSVYSRYSTPRTLAVEADLPVTVLQAGISMTPTVTVIGEIGSTVRIDFIPGFGHTNTWQTLATIVVTNNPQVFLDFSGVGRPARFYRLQRQP
jgi:hypothetical protein